MGLVSENVKDTAFKLSFMVIVFFLATATRGEWLLVFVYLFKEQIQNYFSIDVSAESNLNATSGQTSQTWIESWKLQHLPLFLVLSVSVSFLMYYSLAYGWHYYYYVNRRHQAKEWKCQPDKFLTPANERHEIMLGSLNMLIGSIASGFIACYITNGGYCKLYYNISDRGWLYFLLSTFGFFMYNETMAYYLHRTFHNPFLYRTIHKMHHRYHQPTAWSATAMHPAEFIMYQSYLAATPFIVPIHVVSFVGVLLYAYYYGLCDHSGIKMEALWPWQPDSEFHDNHHKYFHVNFGFNTYLFDWLHDTLRKEDRIYGEGIYGGRGMQPKKTT